MDDPLSLLAFAVWTLAMGMYPLGFMFGVCSACCEQGEPMHAALTMTGFEGPLHGYNMSSSGNTVYPFSRIINNASVPPDYIDGQATSYNSMNAVLYPNRPFTDEVASQSGRLGPTCSSRYLAAARTCGFNQITFTETHVSLQIQLFVRVALRNASGEITNSTVLSCDITYTKEREGFWENKFAPGVFFFLPEDVASFTAESTNQSPPQSPITVADVGTTVVVQRPFLPGADTTVTNGIGVAWENVYEFPLRFEMQISITPGRVSSQSTIDFLAAPSDFQGNSTIPFTTPNPLNVTPNRIILGQLVSGGAGLDFWITGSRTCGQDREGDMLAGWSLTPQYWEAFSANGVLTVTGEGIQDAALPGAYKIVECSLIGPRPALTYDTEIVSGVFQSRLPTTSTLTVTQL